MLEAQRVRIAAGQENEWQEENKERLEANRQRLAERQYYESHQLSEGRCRQNNHV